ncbi:heme-binding protein [Achromobacter piechaudii]|uniref:heme-binding protein n=1 Tax=Achromobacter piechaudii TaxID=72556 RepID=UPI000A49EB20|nr:heme-binding protein [Achromobacter piechaudii]
MAMDRTLVKSMVDAGREIKLAEKDDDKLGPLRLLPGTWKNTPELDGHGFNLISLPFGGSENGYRLLMNQYDEVLNFIVADVGVPNRGVNPADGAQADQTAVALSYSQIITQRSFEDSFILKARGQPDSTFGKTDISEKFNDHGIHHEPGLWIFMADQNISHESGVELSVARMGSIPHGNSFIAVGSASTADWGQLSDSQKRRLIPRINGVVVGGGSDPDERALDPIRDAAGNIVIDYFGPYRYFHENPFTGNPAINGFSGFEPVDTTVLLRHTFNSFLNTIGTIKGVTTLQVDSTIDHAGINRVMGPSIGNTPFITRQADTTAMNCTFVIYEIEDSKTGELRYFLQYAQNVILDFINRPDGHPGRARWPHVSINTLERVEFAGRPEAIVASLPPL